ncbi:MAG: stage II sporulation protein P [Limnochordales bacterium]|nr:stage II sporulation protein P [Limnochordales bacterium]
MVKSIDRETRGPGILFVVVVLLIVGVVAARLLGWNPLGGQGQEGNLPQIGDLGGAVGGSDTGTGGDTGGSLPAAVPTVIIYHTYASQNYSPNEAYTTQGRPGEIVEVGAELARQLEARGIRAIHLQNVNDWPSHAEAYKVAASVVEQKIRATPNVVAVIDVHRDGLSGKPDGYTTGLINNESAAKILLVVGDLDNPELDSNVAFAEQVRAGLNRMYPDLSRGIKIQPINRNGHLHPQHLTAVIGDYTDNNLEEAKRGAAALAAVLAEALRGQA